MSDKVVINVNGAGAVVYVNAPKEKEDEKKEQGGNVEVAPMGSTGSPGRG